MTSKVSAQRRQTFPATSEKRRKPRRQSGEAVALENKESVVQKSRMERTDSDKVIRRNSMERKLSVRNSLRLPVEFLQGLKGLDDSLTRSPSVRGLGGGSLHDSQTSHTSASSLHGPEFTEEQLLEMSKQALQFSEDDDDASVISEVMEEFEE